VSETAGVKTSFDGELIELTLQRAPLNILRMAEMEALTDALGQAEQPEARFLALRAQGPHFCAGADVSEHLPGAAEKLLASFHRLVRRLVELPLPTFALVQGRALGAGCELALACDFVLAEEGSGFGLPEIKLGVYPPVALVLLPSLVGRRRARELVLTGAPIDAATACDWGLVSEVVAEGELGACLEEWLKKLRPLSRAALAQAKAAWFDIEGSFFSQGLQKAERRYLEQLMLTHDAAEGLQAFLDKREPQWRHR
jgi:cyclohexa-1,5-dienecarbonyl-CoA hydratase